MIKCEDCKSFTERRLNLGYNIKSFKNIRNRRKQQSAEIEALGQNIIC